MIKKIILCSLLVLAFSDSSHVFAQQQQLSYYQGNHLHVVEPETRNKTVVTLGDENVLDTSNVIKTDRIVYQAEDISSKLILPDGHLFYQGLQSPYDKAIWIYVERDMIGKAYRFWKYNVNSNTQELVFKNATGPSPNYQYIPIGWSNDKDNVYLEAIDHFDTENLHEGIYQYNLETKKTQKLNIKDHYITTPILSVDRKLFAYSGSFSSGKNRDLIHGNAERLFVYNIDEHKEKMIVEEKGSSFIFSGWVSLNTTAKKLLIDKSSRQEKLEGNSVNMKAAVSLRLPWESGISYCVSRHGLPTPEAPIGSTSRCNIYTFNQHTYVAVDFDTPNNVRDDVLASASGTVTFVDKVGTANAAGKYVIVTHSDSSRTFYFHLDSIYVNLGDCVGQGTPLGDGGNTGGSSGDHIHFEHRIGGNERIQPVFSDCGGCSPRQDYRYVSQNQKNDNCGPACENDINITGAIASGTYTSTSTITSNGTINSGGNVVLDTRNEIYLNTGFNVSSANNTSFAALLGAGCSTSLKEIITDNLTGEESALEIYPNPASGIVNITYSSSTITDIINVKVFDVMGKLVSEPVKNQSYLVGKDIITVDVNKYANGIYFCTFTNSKGVKLTKKILVKR